MRKTEGNFKNQAPGANQPVPPLRRTEIPPTLNQRFVGNNTGLGRLEHPWLNNQNTSRDGLFNPSFPRTENGDKHRQSTKNQKHLIGGKVEPVNRKLAELNTHNSPIPQRYLPPNAIPKVEPRQPQSNVSTLQFVTPQKKTHKNNKLEPYYNNVVPDDGSNRFTTPKCIKPHSNLLRSSYQYIPQTPPSEKIQDESGYKKPYSSSYSSNKVGRWGGRFNFKPTKVQQRLNRFNIMTMKNEALNNFLKTLPAESHKEFMENFKLLELELIKYEKEYLNKAVSDLIAQKTTASTTLVEYAKIKRECERNALISREFQEFKKYLHPTKEELIDAILSKYSKNNTRKKIFVNNGDKIKHKDDSFTIVESLDEKNYSYLTHKIYKRITEQSKYQATVASNQLEINRSGPLSPKFLETCNTRLKTGQALAYPAYTKGQQKDQYVLTDGNGVEIKPNPDSFYSHISKNYTKQETLQAVANVMAPLDRDFKVTINSNEITSQEAREEEFKSIMAEIKSKYKIELTAEELKNYITISYKHDGFTSVTDALNEYAKQEFAEKNPRNTLTPFKSDKKDDAGFMKEFYQYCMTNNLLSTWKVAQLSPIIQSEMKGRAILSPIGKVGKRGSRMLKWLGIDITSKDFKEKLTELCQRVTKNQPSQQS